MTPKARNLGRIFVYLWVMPTTLIGLLFFLPALLSGGRARIVDGVIELHGGVVAFFLRYCTFLRGRDAQLLGATRRHERVHVRQCERWGPLFLPAYLIACLIALLHGKRAYMDNMFEREAYGHRT